MKNNIQDTIYHELLAKVSYVGAQKWDRTNTGTVSLFGKQTVYKMEDGFPLLTTKHVPWKLIVAELLWFLRGDTNILFLQDQNCHIWDEWADKSGNLGPIYGRQWRSWGADDLGMGGIDQIARVIETIKTNPDSRRMVVSTWNVADLEYMALEPCHCLFQFYVNDGKLSLHLYQRSADVFLGVPFNIASYALLLCMIAQVTGLKPGKFIHSFGDVHLYLNHTEQALEQLQRRSFNPPTLWLNPEIKSIDDFTMDDVKMLDYRHHPAIKAPVAV